MMPQIIAMMQINHGNVFLNKQIELENLENKKYVCIIGNFNEKFKIILPNSASNNEDDEDVIQ